MYPQSVEERLTYAEGEIHGLQRAARNHAAAHQLLNTKLDDLSGQVRALEHEVKSEVIPRLEQIDYRGEKIESDVHGLKVDVAELKDRMTGVETGVAALLAHFNITPPSA